MKILVTGGAGFIGSNLCLKLLKLKHKVICMDNLYSGKEENIKSFKDSPHFTFVDHNIVYPFDENSNYIINLACPGSPEYVNDGNRVYDACVIGTESCLRITKKLKIPMMQISSIRVFDQELSSYGEGKLEAEKSCLDYNKKGVQVKIVRFCNVYGNGMSYNDKRVIPTLIRKALNNEDITIYGDGKQLDNFIHVDDATDALIFLMDKRDKNIYTIGSSKNISINDLMNKIKLLTGSTSKIIYDDKTRDVKNRFDLSDLKVDSCFKETVDLDTGLKMMIEDFKKGLKL
jgi:UDP-glucuronate decarboxylase